MHNPSPAPSESSRRDFLFASGVFAAAMLTPPVEGQQSAPTATAPEGDGQETESRPSGPVPGITPETFIEAEKLACVSFTNAERQQMARSIGEQLQQIKSRQKKQPLPNSLAPACTFDPRVPGINYQQIKKPFSWSEAEPGPLPSNDEDIAYAPLTRLAKWIQARQLTSQRLTQIYLERLKQYDPLLKCVITLNETGAMQQARAADDEIASGKYRGPLHGIPWGAKDILDTVKLRTTYGAEPWKDRVPDEDAFVVKMLNAAGAVLLAKLSVGALAYGDIWFGGRTNNPWNLKQGSSGSSAGPAAATAAGLVGFSIGSETYGSITSPCVRCGSTGLRPTFGRVSRTRCMSLCWSLDKIGPIARSVEDCALVLDAISAFDGGEDPSSIEMPFNFDGKVSWQPGMRVGYNPAWFGPRNSKPQDLQALEAVKRIGCTLVEMSIPEWPYDSLLNLLVCEAASAFEAITRDNTDDSLKWQADEAWPNTFRKAWFIPAPEVIQADRFRRQLMHMMYHKMRDADAIIAPSLSNDWCLITNFTGYPSLTLRCGFKDNGSPHGITLIGNLFQEGTLLRLGMALEKELGVWDRRPPLA